MMANKENISRDLAFRKMLITVARNIDESPLADMKFICKSFLPKSVAQKLTSATLFFEYLEEQMKLSKDDVTFLKDLLVHVGKPAEVNHVEVYEREYITNYDASLNKDQEHLTQPVQAEHCDTILEKDLKDAFEYLKEKIGRDWRELARACGLTETDIHSLEDEYPRKLKEQGYQMLLLWKKKKKEQANKEALIHNLRKKRLNRLASEIKNERYHFS